MVRQIQACPQTQLIYSAINVFKIFKHTRTVCYKTMVVQAIWSHQPIHINQAELDTDWRNVYLFIILLIRHSSKTHCKRYIVYDDPENSTYSFLQLLFIHVNHDPLAHQTWNSCYHSTQYSCCNGEVEGSNPTVAIKYNTSHISCYIK